jgi:hypothetical protein
MTVYDIWLETFSFQRALTISQSAKELVDAGLADGQEVSGVGFSEVETIILRLTPDGRAFAEAARDEARWSRVVLAAEAKRAPLVHVAGWLAHPVTKTGGA